MSIDLRQGIVGWRVVSLLALALVTSALVGGRGFAEGEPPAVDITAQRFGFTPDTIKLKKDETVRLRLHSEDVTHGFFMRALKIDTDIEPGKVTELVITPHVPGVYTTICDHFCGAGHGNMKMTIVVE